MNTEEYQVQITLNPSMSILSKYYKIALWNLPIVGFHIVIFIFVAVLAIATFNSRVEIFPGLIMCLSFSMIASPLIFGEKMSMKNYQKIQASCKEQKYVFSSRFIQVSSPSFLIKCNWDEIEKVVETKDFFQIINKSRLVIIPIFKENLTPDEYNSIVEILKQASVPIQRKIKK